MCILSQALPLAGPTPYLATMTLFVCISRSHSLVFKCLSSEGFPQVGELYIHHTRLGDTYDIWLYGQDLERKRVTKITAAGYTTIRGRKGK